MGSFSSSILSSFPPPIAYKKKKKKKKNTPPYQASKDMEILNAYFFKPGFLGQFIFFSV